jgi:proline iminopeptidase
MAAQGYAIKYGKEVNLQALILVAGAPSHEFINTAKIELGKIGTEEQVRVFDHLLTGQITTDDKLRDYFKTMAPVYSLANKTGKAFHAAKKDVKYNARAALAGFGPNGFLRSFDWRKELSSITCSTFIIVGKQDWINHPNQLKEIDNLIPKSQLIIVPDSGHFVWVDQRERYLNAVVEFLRGINLDFNCCQEKPQ